MGNLTGFKTTLALLSGVFAFVSACSQQQATSDVSAAPDWATHLESYFEALADSGEFSGVVLVRKDGETQFHKVWGFADFAAQRPFSADAAVGLASITKSFTAAAVLQLAKEGKLDLDAPLADWLPYFPNSENITIRHLLGHRAGLAELSYAAVPADARELEQLVRQIGARPPLFPPGENQRYSNAGYVILAHLVERASDMAYADYLAEAFFASLELSCIGDLGSPVPTCDLAAPHQPGPPPAYAFRPERRDPALLAGSGSLYANAEALAVWADYASQQFNFADAEQAPYGWGLDEENSVKTIFQLGISEGYLASIRVLPEDSLTIVMVGNLENARWIEWAEAAVAISRGEIRDPAPRPIVDQAPSADERNCLAGRYLLDESQFVDISADQNGFWLSPNGLSVRDYLTPVADGYDLRRFGGRIETPQMTGSECPDEIYWRALPYWGGDVRTFVREG
jgi:CubicO group peptidase (beta-lactamase class C family)